MKFPISTMVALYVLTGCDYVSSFFKHTKKHFIECLFSNKQYILKNNSIISLIEDGNGHKLFDGVLEEPWLNLACSVYLTKHNSIFDGQTLQRFRDTFSNPPLSESF